jgi:hypothetical protein
MSKSAEELLTGYIAPDEQIVDAKVYRSDEVEKQRVVGVTDRRIVERTDETDVNDRTTVDIRTTLFTGPHVTGVDIHSAGESNPSNGGAFLFGFFGVFGVIVSVVGIGVLSDGSTVGVPVFVLGLLMAIAGFGLAKAAYDSGDEGRLSVVVRTTDGAEKQAYNLPPEDSGLAASISEAVGATHAG